MGRVILIVEDDPRNLKLIRDLLQIRGYATLEATYGKQGVDMARAKMPDLILMDIQMPVMDGFKAKNILKADPVTKSIPIIAKRPSPCKGTGKSAWRPDVMITLRSRWIYEHL